MKKLVLLCCLAAAVLLLSQCKKDCKTRPVDNDAAEIEAYATANNITAVRHSSGMYYEILDPGTGVSPNQNSRISITYSGKLLSGYQFDEGISPNYPSWALSDLIEGWRIGIPLIKQGGRIRLIIPSALGYGCEGYGDIPGDAILFFDISLIGVE